MSQNRDGAGDGDPCPGDVDRPQDQRHKRMFMLPSRQQYCAHQSHDRDGTPNLFQNDGVTPVRRTK
jgi:hypothetical protein